MDNIGRHLTESKTHKIKGVLKKRILEWLKGQNVATTHGIVENPSPGGPPIDGLPIYDGLQCRGCGHLSIDVPGMGKHCAKERCEPRAVKVQTLWRKSFDWFVVIPVVTTASPSDCHAGGLQTPTSRRTAGGLGNLQKVEEAGEMVEEWDSIMGRYREIQKVKHDRYRKINHVQHVAELTPLLRATKFHIHLRDLDGDEIVRACRVLREPEIDRFAEAGAQLLTSG